MWYLRINTKTFGENKSYIKANVIKTISNDKFKQLIKLYCNKRKSLEEDDLLEYLKQMYF